MLKQFNLKTRVFADPLLRIDEQGTQTLTTSGDDWVAVYSQDEINAISASVTGGGMVWLENGQLKTSGKAPAAYHRWNGNGWEPDNAAEQAAISAEKSAKLAEINRQAQAFVNELARIDDTPEFERETWPIQREEVKAWQIDPHAPTPTLALIAQVRGVPLDVLRQKAFEKAMAYQTVAAVVAGQRQAYEDRLNMVETLEQIQAIEPVYQLPMNEEEEDVQNDES